MRWPFALRTTLEKYQRETYRLLQENSSLRIALKKAQKNDHRDPKTGRFVRG